jgi:hypothetical protein
VAYLAAEQRTFFARQACGKVVRANKLPEHY